MGCRYRGRVGAFRRAWRVCVRAGRRCRRRRRRTHPPFARGGACPVRRVSGRPLPSRALSSCDDACRVRRARRVGRSVLRRRTSPRVRVRRGHRGLVHPDQAGVAGAAAVTRANAGGTHRVQWGDFDGRERRNPRRTVVRRRAGLVCRCRRCLHRWCRNASGGGGTSGASPGRGSYQPHCESTRRRDK